MTKEKLGRSPRALGCALLAVFLATGVYAAADERTNAVRGRLDLTKCKNPCNSSKTFPVYECAHWNPPGDDSCQNNVCLESTVYYTECARRTFTSDLQDCQMKDQEDAPFAHQQARSTANLTCTGGWGPVPGYPAETDCRAVVVGVPGKCFIGSCPGVDVDEYPEAPGSKVLQKYDPDRTYKRKVCGP